MEIRAGHVRCRFSFGFFALLAVYMLLDTNGLGIPVLVSVTLHECGHLAALYYCGGYVDRVEFALYGIRIEKRGMLTYRGEALVYLGGVCANGGALLLCILLGKWGNFAQINLLLMIFHLLPVGRLDGGALLRLAMYRAGLERQADVLSCLLAILLLLPLFCAAAWMAAKGNYTLLLTAAYLLCAQMFSGE